MEDKLKVPVPDSSIQGRTSKNFHPFKDAARKTIRTLGFNELPERLPRRKLLKKGVRTSLSLNLEPQRTGFFK
jgi:hypothetical protein